MLIEILNHKIFYFHTNSFSNLPILDFHASWKERTELVSFTLSSEHKDIWLLKFRPKITRDQSATFSPQALFCSSCTLETHLSKKLSQTILITNFWRIKNMILFGKHILEEDQLISLLNSSRICSAEWWPSIHQTDQKSNKLLFILGLKEQFALIAKSKTNSVWDKRNWMSFWIREENNRKLKNNKTWLLLPQEESSTEEMEKILKMRLLTIWELNSTWKEPYPLFQLLWRTISFWMREFHTQWPWLRILWETWRFKFKRTMKQLRLTIQTCWRWARWLTMKATR